MPVGVLAVRTGVQLRRGPAGHGDGLGERLAGVAQDVIAGLVGALVQRDVLERVLADVQAGRHGVGRVVAELVRRLGVRRLPGQAPGRQVQHRVRVAERPAGRAAPGVAARLEDPYPVHVAQARVLALEPVVEPAQVLGVHVVRRVRAEVHTAAFGVGLPGLDVAPGADEQVLRIAGRRLRGHVLVVMERAEQVLLVVPPGHVQARHVDLAVAVLVAKRPVEVVEGVVAAQVVPVRARRVDDLADVLERERAQDLVPVIVLEPVEVQDPAPGGKGPPREVELEDAVGVRDLLLPAPGGGRGDHRAQVRRKLRRRGPLHPAHVAEPGRADLAVAPRLGGGPLDDVVGVGRVVDEREPLALRLAPAARVGGHERVAVGLVEHGLVADQRLAVFAVRRDRDDGRHRLLLGARRQVDVGGQFDPVAHRDADLEAPPGAEFRGSLDPGPERCGFARCGHGSRA